MPDYDNIGLARSLSVYSLPYALRSADINDDGVVDTTDILLFAEEHGLEIDPSFEALLADWDEVETARPIDERPRRKNRRRRR